MIDSKRENLEIYSHNYKGNKPKWGEQWNENVLQYLTEKGPLKLFSKMLEKHANEPCLILGFSYEEEILGHFYKKIIGVNISQHEFHDPQTNLRTHDLIVCDAEYLPFKNDGIKNVISRAFLHHINPHKGLSEIKRIISNDGFLYMWEPGKFNPVAAIGRKFFPTRVHAKTEKPFNPTSLKNLIEQDFGLIKYQGYFHITSSILPILAKYFKLFQNKKILNFADKFDQLLAKTFFRYFAWVIIFGAVKSS